MFCEQCGKQLALKDVFCTNCGTPNRALAIAKAAEETKPVETKPVETKPVETKPVETKIIGTYPNQPMIQPSKPVVSPVQSSQIPSQQVYAAIPNQVRPKKSHLGLFIVMFSVIGVIFLALVLVVILNLSTIREALGELNIGNQSASTSRNGRDEEDEEEANDENEEPIEAEEEPDLTVADAEVEVVDDSAIALDLNEIMSIELIGVTDNVIEATFGQPISDSDEINMRRVKYDDYGYHFKYDLQSGEKSNQEVVSMYLFEAQKIDDHVLLGTTKITDLIALQASNMIYDYMEYVPTFQYVFISDEGVDRYVYHDGSGVCTTAVVEKRNPAKERLFSATSYMDYSYEEIIEEFGPYYQLKTEDSYTVLYYFGLPYEFYFVTDTVSSMETSLPHHILGYDRGYAKDDAVFLGRSRTQVESSDFQEFLVQILPYPDWTDVYDTLYHYRLSYSVDGYVNGFTVYRHLKDYQPISEWEDLALIDYLDIFTDANIEEVQRFTNRLKALYDVEIYIAVTDQLYGMTVEEYGQALYRNRASANSTGGYSLLFMPYASDFTARFTRFDNAPLATEQYQKLLDTLIDNHKIYNYDVKLNLWEFLAGLESILKEM